MTTSPEDAGAAVNRALGALLREARDVLGYSRAALVEMLAADLTPMAIAHYEEGRRSVSVHRLLELCAALGLYAPTVLATVMQRLDARKCPCCGHPQQG